MAKERKKSDLFVFSQWLKTLNLSLQKSKLFCVYVRGIKPAFLAMVASCNFLILKLTTLKFDPLEKKFTCVGAKLRFSIIILKKTVVNMQMADFDVKCFFYKWLWE